MQAGGWQAAPGVGDGHRLQEHFGVGMQPALAKVVPGGHFHQPA